MIFTRTAWMRIFRWTLPVGTNGLLALLWPSLEALFKDQAPPTLYYFPVLISGAFGGLGPGFLATLLSAPFAYRQYQDLIEKNPNLFSSPAQFDLRVGLFLFLGIAIAWLCGRTRDAVTAARNAAAQAQLDRELLTGARDQLSQIIQLNLIGIAILNPAGQLTDANDSFLQLVGKTRHDMAQNRLHWKQLLPTSEADQILQTVARDGICPPIESESIRPDGTRLPVLVRAALQKSTNQIVAFVVDLSDLRLAEAQLRHNRRLLERIAEATPDMLFVLKLADLSIKFVNDSIADILGHPAQSILNMQPDQWRRIIQPQDWPALAALAARFDAEPDGKVLQIQCRMNKPDGQSRLILLRGVAFERAPDGTCREILGLGQDVTEQAEAQIQLAESHTRLQAASRAKDQFLAALSHELRTPLNPVLGIVTMLEGNPSLAAPVRDDLRVVRRNVELEARLIDDLLDLTRITNNKLKLHPEIIRAHEKAINAIQICRDEITAKGIELETHLDAPVQMLNADAARCQQVFWNLLKNAVKFTPAGGRVTLRSNNPNPNTWCLQVIDSGVGIPAAMLPRIFDAFEQAGRQGQFGGLGLGLAISKTVIELHGGRITATSPGPGCGATFCVELPTTSEIPRAEVPPQLPSQSSPGNLRVLLVEDHPDTAHVMERVLKSMGHTVLVATSVQEALAIINTAAFDLLISDIGLPDGTGHDVIRASRARHPVPSIAVTGFGMEADIARTRQSGFDAHVTKPVDIHRLAELIERIAHPAEVSA